MEGYKAGLTSYNNIRQDYEGKESECTKEIKNQYYTLHGDKWLRNINMEGSTTVEDSGYRDELHEKFL